MKRLAIHFAGDFCGRIRRKGVGQVGFAFAADSAIAVGGPARGIDDAPHACTTRRVQNRYRAGRACGMAVQGAFDAQGHRRQRRFVKDAIDPADGLGHQRGVGYVALDELDRIEKRFEVHQPPGRKIIDHADAIAARDERFGNVRSNKTGSAGNQDRAHGNPP